MNVRAYAAAYAATFTVVVLALTHSPVWWLTVIPAGLYALGWADNAVNFQFAPERFVVYYLHDSAGRLVYIGSTNDVQRRALEHTNRASHEYKPSVETVLVARYCRSERQAQRIETRRIRALTRAHRGAFCGPLLNETWTVRPPGPAARAWTVVWMCAYLAESWLHPDRRWHTPNRTGYRIPPRETGQDDSRWDDPFGPADDPWTTAEDTVTEATYERPVVHALGPARYVTRNDVTNPASPPRRGDSHARNASRDATDPPGQPRPKSNAERQRAYRERQRRRKGHQ